MRIKTNAESMGVAMEAAQRAATTHGLTVRVTIVGTSLRYVFRGFNVEHYVGGRLVQVYRPIDRN